MSNNSADTDNATLLYHSAASAHSHFGSTVSTTSSSIFGVRYALEHNFGFNANIYPKDDYLLWEWTNLLESNIDENRPIYYRGGGHAWIIDGYNTDSKFHCNWGWNGSSNDWYMISSLFIPGFDTGQHAILNLYPIDCSDINIINTTFNNNASYNGCSITVENCTIKNGAKLILDSDCK